MVKSVLLEGFLIVNTKFVGLLKISDFTKILKLNHKAFNQADVFIEFLSIDDIFTTWLVFLILVKLFEVNLHL
jgi:hypothetical protein